MAHCTRPKHVNQLEFLRRVTAGKTNVPKWELPLWTKDAKGRGPYLLVLQAYDWQHNLELEVEVRPCKVCWRRLMYGWLGIPFAKLELEHPVFADYIGKRLHTLDPELAAYDKFRHEYKEAARMTTIVLRALLKNPEAMAALGIKK